MSDHEYSGPRVPQTPMTEAQVRLRFNRKVEAAATLHHAEAVRKSSAADDGRFPDRAEITRETAVELERPRIDAFR